MKKISLFFLLLVAVACNGPRSYVQKAVKIMDRNALFAEGPQWAAARNKALFAIPKDLDEAHEVVREALSVAGGKHSALRLAEEVQLNETAEWNMPAVSITSDSIALIRLPRFAGNDKDAELYAKTVLDSVPDFVTGAIIDLRANTGGNMYPMIASVHRFISDAENMLSFKGRKRTDSVPMSFVLRSVGVPKMNNIDCPVAVLTDSLTASSGEAALICFLGLENVRTFGYPTAGYASCNTSYDMPDGSKLVLTTGCDVARTGLVYCDEPIEPNQRSDSPQDDAFSWIIRMKQERQKR